MRNTLDDTARQATDLLEDVARKGRSFGIHLVLASQTASGIEAHLPCQSTRPLSSTTQIEVWSCDTSKPTYCFMAVLHGGR